MQNFFMELMPLWLSRKIKPGYSRPKKENAAASLIRSIVFIIIFGYFFIRAYMVPTPSMVGTINPKDFLLVNRFMYGVKTPDQIGIPMTNIYFVRELPTVRLTPSLRDINPNDVLVFRADHEEPPVEYVKRLVGAPGHTIEMKEGTLYSNGAPLKVAEKAVLDTENNLPKDSISFNRRRDILITGFIQGGGQSQGIAYAPDFPYNKPTKDIIQDIIDISLEFTLVIKMDLQNPEVYKSLERQVNMAKRVRSSRNSIEFSEQSYKDAIYDSAKDYLSARMYADIKNIDDFPALYIPKEGDKLNLKTTHSDIISNIVFYDGHTLNYQDSTYYIDGVPAETYTVKQDYYFFVGDNRHGSLDSRHWGMIPHKYIIGTPILKYFSINEEFWNSGRRKNASFFKKTIDLFMNLDEAINWDQIGKIIL